MKKILKTIAPWAAGGHAEGLLVCLAQAADAEEDGDHDECHRGGQHHVQHHGEVRALGQAAHLDKRHVLEGADNKSVKCDI